MHFPFLVVGPNYMCNVAGRHRKAIGNIGWGCHGYLKTPLNRRPATPPASERHRENRENVFWCCHTWPLVSHSHCKGSHTCRNCSYNVGPYPVSSSLGHWGFRGTCCGVRAAPAMVTLTNFWHALFMHTSKAEFLDDRSVERQRDQNRLYVLNVSFRFCVGRFCVGLAFATKP